MLAIGRALMSKPKLLLLDEPSMGLAPMVLAEIFRAIADFRKQGLTAFFVEQNARAALKIADRGYVLETGGIVMEGTAEELMENREVQRAYLWGRGIERFGNEPRRHRDTVRGENRAWPAGPGSRVVICESVQNA